MIQCEIEIVAYYEFLHVFTLLYKQKPSALNPSGPVRFQNFLERILESDKIKSELDKLVFVSQQREQLSLFLDSLSRNSWHQWFDIRKVELIVKESALAPREHEIVTNTKPESYHKYNTITPFVLANCSKWATLIGKKSWIKFFNEQEPTSFCLFKLIWETPKLVVAHLAFFRTSQTTQTQAVKEFSSTWDSQLVN